MDLGISCLLGDLEHCSQVRALFTLWDTACCINYIAQTDDSAEYCVMESVPSCLHDANLDYYQIIIIMVITCSTSGVGSCERARALMSQWSSAARRGVILFRLCAKRSTRTAQFLHSYRRNRYGVTWWPTGTLHSGLYMFKFKIRSRIVKLFDL